LIRLLDAAVSSTVAGDDQAGPGDDRDAGKDPDDDDDEKSRKVPLHDSGDAESTGKRKRSSRGDSPLEEKRSSAENNRTHHRQESEQDQFGGSGIIPFNVANIVCFQIAIYIFVEQIFYFLLTFFVTFTELRRVPTQVSI
jgi:hypothetical protein